MGGYSLIDFLKDQIQASFTIKKAILEDDGLVALIKQVALKTVEVYTHGNKVLLAGNGGSAADAQHLAGELVNRLYFDRPGLPAIALTTDTSVITAISNDSSYEAVFARQIQAIGGQGDLFIGISTSGNSGNIIQAFRECRTKGIITVGFTGQGNNKMEQLADYCIKVPSIETPRIQESHILIGHIICAVVEKAIFGGGF